MRDEDGDDGPRRARARRVVAAMSPTERLALVVNLLIDSLVELGDVPSDLRPSLRSTVDELLASASRDPHEFAAAVLRRHGYHAEPRDLGGYWMLRAERLDS